MNTNSSHSGKPQDSSQAASVDVRESILEARVSILSEQNALLLKKVRLLSAIVQEVPSIILNARLDEKQGKPTTYDYRRSSEALNAREF